MLPSRTALFRDRVDAGRRLGAALAHLAGDSPVVLGLPRGGVPVAFEVAAALSAPLDVIVVRKLGLPFQPELGMGAVGEDGARALNADIIRLAGISDAELAAVEERERAEVTRRAALFRAGRPAVPLAGRTVVVVDDGIATGGTARAALQTARARGVARLVLAVPVAAPETLDALAPLADEIVALATPADLVAIGYWYADFAQTSDDTVIELLRRNRQEMAEVDPDRDPAETHEEAIPIGAGALAATLDMPAQPAGLVVFAHGSGSSRHSARNRSVAAALNRAGLATLLLDLLTVDEALDRSNVFDIALLGERIEAALSWRRAEPRLAGLPVGLFGASTGAAAALVAAADRPAEVAAVVSRGGRPDLAANRLREIKAPTLLIVGGHDQQVLALNRAAAAELRCEHRLEIIPGATHLFEEPGALGEVARLAGGWFTTYLTRPES
ncbi:MAG: phosphoribosyltransferase family protein [Acidimicrobiales bacterium]